VILPDLPELDIQTGLRSLGGKRARYRQLLDKFVQQHGEDVGRIRAALEQMQFDEARRLAHSLKGVAGTLGATAVSEAAREVELPLKAAILDQTPPAGLEPLLDNLQACLRTLLDGLSGSHGPM